MLDKPVFANSKGNYRRGCNVILGTRRLVGYANSEGADIPVGLRFHDLRHTNASILISSGMSLKAIAARLGHADASILLRQYAHLLPGDDEALSAKTQELLG